MIIELTEEQLDYKKEAIKFARAGLNDDNSQREKKGEFSTALWKKC